MPDFLGFVCKFGGIVVFPKQSLANLSAQLERAGRSDIDPQRFSSGAALLSLAASTLITAAAVLAGIDALEAFSLLILAFGCIFGLLYFLPFFLAARRIRLAEAELPFLVREAAVCIEIGMPFEKCIEQLSKRGYVISKELAGACMKMKAGATVQNVLLEVASKLQSMQIKRCFMMMCSIYETGGSSESLKQLSAEIASQQLSQMRLQAGRLSLLLILFVASSAMLPSFFTVFAAILPSLGDRFPQWVVFACFLFLFPLINLLCLLLAALQMPALASQENIGWEFYLAKYGQNAKKLSLAVWLLLAAAAAFSFYDGKPQYAMLAFFGAAAVYGALSFLASKQLAEAETRLPDALYAAASAHRLFSPERLLAFLSKSELGLLSEAFEVALRRLKGGESFSGALNAAAAHCPSWMVRRALTLLVISYETGANMYFALKEAAQDMASFFGLVEERRAQLAIQRYTILAAGGILVPAIVAITSSLALISAGEAGEIASQINFAAPIYLAINASISSFVLGFAEGSLRKSWLYFAFMVPSCQLVFMLFAGQQPALLINPSVQIT
ncbi:MAG: type II secretion system F family protein [Candidatus Micrarchaeota archaeon]|nr:type II secretion system F family protein [Candidatus Micrarchaeota archaeon]